MPVKLASTQLYNTGDSAHFYDETLNDVELLWDAKAFTSAVTLIACSIGALALSAGVGGKDKAKYTSFMEQHFLTLCNELQAVGRGKTGATIFYEKYRNGLAHVRGPKSGYALARTTETAGKYVEVFDVEHVGRYIGINVDRLHSDFVAAVEACRKAGHP